MRLALIRQRYTPFGGAERFVERALAALAGQHMAVTLIAREWLGAAAQPVITCAPFHLGRLWRDWSFARCVRATLERERFDLVQSHERIAGCDIYRAGDGVHAAWLEHRCRTQGWPGRLWSRLSPWHRYTLAAEARMFRDPRLRAVICNSHMVRDDIGRRFGVAPEKLHVIYNGVDLEAFHPRLGATHRARQRAALGIAGAAPLFLYVGSGFERKGVPQLLAAFASMGNREARLIIVGRDRQQPAMERRASALGIAARVHFAGAQKDVGPWYGAADAFVLPTLYDPFPNAALEALACGLPVITSTSCGAAELVRDGYNGYVCDALDIGALTRHLDALAVPGAAPGMAAAARESVAALSVAAMAQRLVELYRSLLRTAAEASAATTTARV
jgi:UDP-glucose:(heptosyl)LPS alpha-1,3-glucosyltransferase